MSVFMLLGGLGLFVNGHVLCQPTYQYFTPGDTTCINCIADCDQVTWNGPAWFDTVDNTHNVSNVYGEIYEWETTVYGNRNKTNAKLPHASRLKPQNVDGTFILTIVNTSQEDEGLYVCEASQEEEMVKVKRTLLQKRRRPSKITFQNETGGMVLTGKEHHLMIINCTENTALPPSYLALLENGKILVTNAIGQINYTITPTKDDINTTFRCTSTNLYWNSTISKDVVIDVQFTPSVKFNDKTFEAIEGNKAELCCRADSNPMVQNMQILHDGDPLHATGNSDKLCYSFQNLKRIHSGNYVCLARNDIGQGNASTEITIMYPPDVTMSVSTNSNHKTMLKCVANGFPTNYRYGLWEHCSFFGEHIRYLNSSTGQLVLSNTPQQEKYQDSGYYTCNVSNGIRDLKGNLFQEGSLSVESPDPPFLLPGNRRIQNGSKDMKGEIQFSFLSLAPITCVEFTPLERWFAGFIDEHEIVNITAKTIFHKIQVTVKGSKVVYVFNQSQQEHFQWYRITVCNRYGNLSFEVNFNQVAQHENVDSTTSALIPVLESCMLVILLMAVAGFFIVISRYRRTNGHARSQSSEGSNHLYDYCDSELYHTADHVTEERINQLPVTLDYEVPVTDGASMDPLN